MIDKPKTVTVGARIEFAELEKLKQLAKECGISVCAYLRDLVRLEMTRAKRPEVHRYPAPVEVVKKTPVDRNDRDPGDTGWKSAHVRAEFSSD